MCFHSKQSKDATTLQQRFKAKVANGVLISPNDNYNGFAKPSTPIISKDNPSSITLAQWGLVPAWASFKSFNANTLNAQIETLDSKPSFKSYIDNRCLILADGFYEWKWLDAKGKNKEKYLITLAHDDAFAFAGIYSDIVDPSTGELIRTYSIITTAANALMAEIHNIKKRMPIILRPEQEQDWLSARDYKDFEKCDINLKASIQGNSIQTLF